MEHLTLSLHLRINDQNQFTVTAHGPHGEWGAHHTPNPFEDQERQEKIIWVHELVAAPEDIHQLGDHLGRLLFTDSIRILFNRLRQQLQADQLLQIRLHLPVEDESPILTTCPWETMRLDNQYLVMSPKIIITRTIDLPRPFSPPVPHKPIDTLLLVGANFADRRGNVDIEGEFAEIQRALEERVQEGKLRIDQLINPSLAELEAQLRDHSYDICHILTHGMGEDNPEKQPRIILRGADDSYEIIGADRFTAALLGTDVRLITINTSGGQGFSGMLAKTLLTADVPYVIAHNNNLKDKTGTQFAARFYQELTKHGVLGIAMFAARRAMAQIEETFWSSPALYSHASGSQFWASDSEYVLQTQIDANGRLSTTLRKRGELDINMVQKQVENVYELFKKITNPDSRAKISTLLSAMQDALNTGDIETANQRLQQITQKSHLALQEQRQQRTVLVATLTAFGIILILALALGYFGKVDVTIPVLNIPLSVIAWSALGGVAAILQEFVGSRKLENRPFLGVEWLVWRPIVGMFMGSVIFLVLNAGLIALGQGGLPALSEDTEAAARQTLYLIWTLAFLGGFSDRFTNLIFDNIITNVTKKQEEGQQEEDTPQETTQTNTPPPPPPPVG